MLVYTSEPAIDLQKMPILAKTNWQSKMADMVNIYRVPHLTFFQLTLISWMVTLSSCRSWQIIMVISFLQRRCHPVTRCIKIIADQPCYNVIFYMRRTEHTNIKKGFTYVYQLLRSVARSIFFRLYILSACFNNQKKILLLTMCLRLLHKTMNKLNSKLDNNTRRLFWNFIW